MSKIRNLLDKSRLVIRDDGVRGLVFRPSRKIKRRLLNKKIRLRSMVSKQDLISADWVDNKFRPKNNTLKTDRYNVAWIMSPPSRSSGGHQNLFRFINYMEKAGHKCTIYLYSTDHFRSIETIRDDISSSYPILDANFVWIKDGGDIPTKHDAIFATGWETAYPAFSVNANRKFYFVQDFEPAFYPVGSESILAENTYHFGYYGITAGGWLAKKLKQDYNMQTASFDFSADTRLYKRTNNSARRDIFFYARPVTSRRAFELGISTLEIFSKENPNVVIHMAGWDVRDYELPFKYIDHGIMKVRDLAPLYNKCCAALVLSLTNMSLLPLELLACGTIPVVNDAPNNRLVSNNKHIVFTPPSPISLARELGKIIDDKNQINNSHMAALSMEKASWDKSGEQFIQAFIDGMGVK
jgi:O-antigen biosynthesis protein